MTSKQLKARSRAVSSAVASVRAEGLSPSKNTIDRLEKYASGRMTVNQLKRETLKEVRSKLK
jgi:hypothetical protein